MYTVRSDMGRTCDRCPVPKALWPVILPQNFKLHKEDGNTDAHKECYKSPAFVKLKSVGSPRFVSMSVFVFIVFFAELKILLNLLTD